MMSRSYDTKNNNNRVDTNDSNSEYHRPRRPNGDTIAYLVSLPLDLQVAQDELTQFLEQQQQQQCNTNDNNEEVVDSNFPELFSASWIALNEIQNEIASIASGPESGGTVLELLIRITVPYSDTAARLVLYSCLGYAIHLSTHRYGSHVLQTLLEQCCQCNTNSTADLVLHPEAPPPPATTETILSTLPSLTELIVLFCQELQPHVQDLAIHICGSHVVRALLCVLGGVELIATDHPSGQQQRGKLKPKKKKKMKNSHNNTDETTKSINNNSGGPMMMNYQRKPRIDVYDTKIHEALNDIAIAITGDNASQQLAIHSSACPLLIVLLYVLTYTQNYSNNTSSKNNNEMDDRTVITANTNANKHLGVIRSEPYYSIDSSAHQLVQRLLGWTTTSSSTMTRTKDILYQLTGDPRGSRIIETIFRLSPDPIYESLLTVGGWLDTCSSSTSSMTPLSTATIKEYVHDDIRNYIIQTMLTTIRTEQQMEHFIMSLLPYVQNGYILQNKNKRRGILWRMTELLVATAKKWNTINNSLQSKLLECIRSGFALIEQQQNNDTNITDNKNIHIKPLAFHKCIAKLINIQHPNGGNENGVTTFAGSEERIGVDVAGVRSFHYILQFDPKLLDGLIFTGSNNGFIKGISPTEIELIIKDPLSSRCVFDCIFDNHNNSITNKQQLQHPTIWSKAVKQLLIHLSGRWIHLSIHRVGHHTVKKLFFALSDMKDKEILVKELIDKNTSNSYDTNSSGNNNNRLLSSNNMGRSIMDTLAIREYQTGGVSEWSRIIQQSMDNEKLIQSNDDVVASSSTNDSTSNKRRRLEEADTNHDDEKEKVADDSDNGKVISSTKKKIKSNKKEKAMEIQPSSKKNKTRKSSVIDSIFDAITIPGSSRK